MSLLLRKISFVNIFRKYLHKMNFYLIFNFTMNFISFSGMNIYQGPVFIYQRTKKKKFLCLNCPSSFTHQKYLTYHLKHECGRGPRFFCPYCDHKAKFSSGARDHLRRKHPGLKAIYIDSSKQATQ